jgi:hypothetical protein
MYQHNFTSEFALIGTSVLVSLMETLVEKGVLSRADVEGIFSRAASQMQSEAPTSAPVVRAAVLINDHILPVFGEDRT